VGALLFRLAATALAIYLIHASWLKLLGGLYLLYLAASHFVKSAGSGERSAQEAKPLFGLPAFWATVVRVELVNLAFSIDSILVAVAMSSKFWVVLTGGLLGVVAMRLVVSQLIAVIKRYPRLIDGAFLIIAWVGFKLLVDYAGQMAWIAWDIPHAVSLVIVVVILLVSYGIARIEASRARTP
jgi:YkoY family integral membrane protein